MIDEPMTEKEMEELAEALEEANDMAYKVEYLSSQKMPCPECGGNGTMGAGSFGTIPCLGCNGARFVDHPSMHGQGPPPGVAQIRAWTRAFRGHGQLLDRWNHSDPADRGEPPPRAALPTVAEVMKATIRLAKSAPSRSLPAAERQNRLRGGGGGRKALAADLSDDDEGQDDGFEEDEY